jgi:ABC-type Fe3+ transport system substrate-binding protein
MAGRSAASYTGLGKGEAACKARAHERGPAAFASCRSRDEKGGRNMLIRSAGALMRLLMLVTFFLVMSAVARAETMAQLYSKAKEEKSLVFYSGGPVAPYERWSKEFKERFPGIEVSITGGFSNVLDEKIDQQIKAGKLKVDMAILQTVQDFVGWKLQGALLRFKPEGFDKIDRRFRDKDGAFMATSVVLLSYAYNPKLVAAADVPKSALDFLKPQFRGKLVSAYPADDDATLFVFDDIVRRYGWGYMKKYMANKPNFIQGHLGVLRSIAEGKNTVTFDSTSSTTGALKRGGQPIDFAIPIRDKMPVFFVTAGIFKLAPHPNAAKLFLSWFLEKEQQSRLGTFSPRSDVPPPPGLKPLSAYRIDARYKAFVTNAKRLNALRKRFEAFTGPVVNKGGVR